MVQAVVEQASLRDKLRQAFAKVKMPTSPGVATRILALANDPNSTFEHFAEVIRMDAALAARVIKMANSAHYGQASAVTSIPRAVSLLGMSQVRAAALGFQLVGHLNKLGGCPFDMQTYWQQSVLRACLMRIVAQKVAPRLVEEAFLVGLLQDCGILLLVQLLGAPYADFCRSCNLSPTAFFNAEQERFPHNHVEACTTIAEEWKLPQEIILPISRHHTAVELNESSTDVDRLSGVSYLVGSMRFTCNLTFDSSEPELHEYAKTNLNLSAEDLADFLMQTADAYGKMAEMMGEKLPEDVDVTDLLSEANRQLTKVAGEAEERVHTVEAEREAVLREQTQLQSSLGEYREKAARDPLTGIFNRGALLDSAMGILAAARDNGSDVAAFFLDIDNFKKLNDRYGHATGDSVLTCVAKTIAGCAVNAGCAGRYGGEEFVIILSGMTEPQTREHADRVVAQVRSIDYKSLGLDAPVTCSLGAAWGQAGDCDSAEQVMDFADGLMYEAKRSGKDRACFRRMDSGSDTAPQNPKRSASPTVSGSSSAGPTSKPVPVDFEAAMRKAGASTCPLKTRMLDERKHPRKELGYACKAHLLVGDPPKAVLIPGRVRNLSSGGVSLLVTRIVRRGEVVEVCLELPNKPPVFLGGVAAFCRHVEGAVHEVGLQLLAHGTEPIFSVDPISAAAALDWVANGLNVMKQAAAQPVRIES